MLYIFISGRDVPEQTMKRNYKLLEFFLIIKFESIRFNTSITYKIKWRIITLYISADAKQSLITPIPKSVSNNIISNRHNNILNYWENQTAYSLKDFITNPNSTPSFLVIDDPNKKSNPHNQEMTSISLKSANRAD